MMLGLMTLRAAAQGIAPSALPHAAAMPEAAALFPGIALDRAAACIEVRGRVIGGPVEWLELLACRPGTREHESVVTLDARAEHLHAALLLLGLEPGAPADARWEGETLVQTPPRGPELGVWFVFDSAPQDPVPAAVYVVEQARGATLHAGSDAGADAAVDAAGGWRFTGSRLVEGPQRTYFLAEENGTLISLVNFGDDLIARDTRQAADGGNGLWTLNRVPEGWPVLPDAGTPLTVRLGRLPPPDPGGRAPELADNPGQTAPQR